MRLAERMRRALAEQPLRIGEQELTLTLSIGAAEKDSVRCASVDQLIKAADTALYRAKAKGRNRVEIGR